MLSKHFKIDCFNELVQYVEAYRTDNKLYKGISFKERKELFKMAPRDSDYLLIAHQRSVEKKTHVSFPQLKYPSLRDEGLKDPVQWLTGKAMDDGAEGLWRIHDGIYDFNEFMHRHPGGVEWLELTKGTDITEAFECHHLTSSVERMLTKFYIRSAKTPRNSPFTFKEDGFYRTLKRAVAKELEKIPKDTVKKSHIVVDGLFITCLVTSALACWFTNYWQVMVSYLIAGVSMGLLAIASHNYIHMRSNWRMYLFNFSMWSYRDFRVSHALSHHLYTNTLMDLEVSGFEPLLLWNPRKDKPVYTYFALLIEFILFPLLTLLSFMRKIFLYITCKNFFTQHYRWHDGLGLLLPIWMSLASGLTLYDAFSMWLWITCTGSFVLFTIGLNAAHHHPKIFTDGDEVSDVNPDWGMHQLEAVMDRKDVNSNFFTVLTFFGDHALHHLFPTVDHALLKYLYPVFVENCEKFRANFRLTSSLDLFIGQIKMNLKTEPTLLAEKD